MLKLPLAIFCIFFSVNSFAEKDSSSSEISSSDIKKYIKSERKVLRGKYKVQLPQKFTSVSSVYANRYGNTKQVLNLNSLSLSGQDLRGTVFTMASMIKTDLSGADLSNSDLVYVDLTSANLTNANFTKADLSNAVFEATRLRGANFKGANLFGAKFIKISDLTKEELNALKKRTNSYVNLDKEPLPDYYQSDD